MNLILLFPEDFTTASTVRLTGRRLQYVQEVHRASVGEDLTVGVAGGRIGRGSVTSISPEALEMNVTLDCDPPAKLPLTLLLALPRPKVLNRLFVAISSMGVERLILLNCWRVEKTYWSTPRLEEANIRHQLILGLEQARDTVMPQVEIRRRFVPFVEDELPSLVRESTPLVAHPPAERECPRAVASRVTLAIGPEGGFIENEINMLKARGFIPVHLGSRPLRVEHAVPALVGRLF